MENSAQPVTDILAGSGAGSLPTGTELAEAAVGRRPALPREAPRLAMMRRQAGLSLECRISLFEALSRDAAWARRAIRIR